MSGNGNWQRMLQEKRLQHQLEIQSRQIETVLSKNEVDAQVQGGYVESRSIRFDLSSHLEAGLGRLRFLKDDILNALGVADVEILQTNGRWHLNVKRPDNPPVSLLDMLPIISDLPPLTAILGMNEEGSPLLIELSESHIPHIFVSGDANAGKSSLLKTIAVSLAVSNKQSQLQLVVLDAANGNNKNSLGPLSYLPHVVCSVAEDRIEHQELLEFLLSELAYRQEQNMTTPGIVVLIDEVVCFIRTLGNFAAESLATLLQRGPSVGIHLVMATDQPESTLLTQTMRLNLPLHLVGRSENVEKHNYIPGDSKQVAAYLLGEGDFLAVQDDEGIHFQAAFIGDYDLHLTLETLHRNRPTPLLAHSFLIDKPNIQNSGNDISLVRFDYDERGIQLEDFEDSPDDFLTEEIS